MTSAEARKACAHARAMENQLGAIRAYETAKRNEARAVGSSQHEPWQRIVRYLEQQQRATARRRRSPKHEEGSECRTS